MDVSSLMLIAPTSTFNRQNQTATTSCAVCLVLGDGAMELFVVWVYIAVSPDQLYNELHFLPVNSGDAVREFSTFLGQTGNFL